MGAVEVVGLPDRPALSEKCGSCSHEFAKHWRTFGGHTMGCSYRHDDQRDGLYVCECKGFAWLRDWQ